MLRRGRPGSAKLREALESHRPDLALTRSQLERAFFALCESAGLPLPEINARHGRMTVDATWRHERVIVELDGYRGHRTRAQIERDRRRELRLRAAGYTVVRYRWSQIMHESDLVIADLVALLRNAAVRPRAGAESAAPPRARPAPPGAQLGPAQRAAPRPGRNRTRAFRALFLVGILLGAPIHEVIGQSHNDEEHCCRDREAREQVVERRSGCD